MIDLIGIASATDLTKPRLGMSVRILVGSFGFSGFAFTDLRPIQVFINFGLGSVRFHLGSCTQNIGNN